MRTIETRIVARRRAGQLFDLGQSSSTGREHVDQLDLRIANDEPPRPPIAHRNLQGQPKLPAGRRTVRPYSAITRCIATRRR